MKRNYTNQFDKHFKDKLSGYKSNSPADFEAFEKRLDNEYAFDKKASSLSSLHSSSTSQWDTIKTLLDRRAHWYPRIWRLKALEFTTIILIVFSLVNFIPQPNQLLISHSYVSSPNLTNIEQYPTFLGFSNTNYTFEKTSNDHSESSLIDVKPQSTFENNVRTTPIVDENSKIHSSHDQLTKTKVVDLVVSTTRNSFSKLRVDDEKDIALVSSLNVSQLIPDHMSSHVIQEITSNQTPKSISSIRVESIPQPIEQLNESYIQTLEPTLHKKNTIPQFSISNVESKHDYLLKRHIGASFSTDVNLENSLGGTHVGYGFNMFVDFECTPRWFVRSNITLSMSTFNEIRQSQIAYQSSTLDYVSDVNSHLVSVSTPITANYIFYKDEKWRVYAGAGVSMNAILSRSYSGTKSHQSSNLSLQNQIQPNEFEGGLIEGGLAEQNIHFGGLISAGIERQLGASSAIFIQPSMYMHLVPDPSIDAFHRFSVQIGLKTTF